MAIAIRERAVIAIARGLSLNFQLRVMQFHVQRSLSVVEVNLTVGQKKISDPAIEYTCRSAPVVFESSGNVAALLSRDDVYHGMLENDPSEFHLPAQHGQNLQMNY